MRLHTRWVLPLMLAGGLSGQQATPRKNTVVIRGQPQDLYFYPASGSRRVGPLVYLPGDGGWRGFALDMAKAMASFGYDVYAWDTKQYLTGFTSPRTWLKETDVMGDSREIARFIVQGKSERVVVAGWSEGASLALLAAASPDAKAVWRGLVAIGLPEHGALGWRLADNLTYLTKKEPDEPRFSTSFYLPRAAPLPTALIYSSRDEYIPPAIAKKLFDATAEPKRFLSVDARDHRFSGNQSEFFGVLREALAWIQSSH